MLPQKKKQTNYAYNIKLPARPNQKPKKLIFSQLIKQKNNINIITKKKILEYL
jgi:hypothetical protein